MSEISNRPKRHALMTMMTLNAAMTDELLDRLRAVLWSVNGEPNANGNVDETVCSEAADCIEALRIDRDRIAAEWAEVSQRNYQRAKKAEAVRDEWIKNAQTAIFEDSAELELITDEVKRLRTVLSDIEIASVCSVSRAVAAAALKGETNE